MFSLHCLLLRCFAFFCCVWPMAGGFLLDLHWITHFRLLCLYPVIMHCSYLTIWLCVSLASFTFSTPFAHVKVLGWCSFCTLFDWIWLFDKKGSLYLLAKAFDYHLTRMAKSSCILPLTPLSVRPSACSVTFFYAFDWNDSWRFNLPSVPGMTIYMKLVSECAHTL